jgi:hypothetical protein
LKARREAGELEDSPEDPLCAGFTPITSAAPIQRGSVSTLACLEGVKPVDLGPVSVMDGINRPADKPDTPFATLR